MDELTAVRQLLAERPPPAPAAVAAARASLERAGLRAAHDRTPLRLSGGQDPLGLDQPGAGRPARRQRWRGWRVPVAAALAVITAVGVAVAISGAVGGPQNGKPARPAAAAFARLPRYFVALTGGNTLPDQGRRAVVAATATGTVLGGVAVPAPYRVFSWVAAAGDDRTFVLAAQRARPVPGDPGRLMGAGAARLYRLVLHASGRPGALEPLRLPLLTGNINGFALSPDGSRLAVSTLPAALAPGATGAQLHVFTLATGAARSWTLTGAGWFGQSKPRAQSLSWAGDNRTLLIEQRRGAGGATAQLRLLDTAARGPSLAADSTPVPLRSALVSGHVEGLTQIGGLLLLSADGHHIITAVTTQTWHGRPVAAPQVRPATVAHRLPVRCRASGPQLVRPARSCEQLFTRLLVAANRPILAGSGAIVTFTRFSAATAKPVATLGRVRGEGEGITWAEVTWASPDGSAMIIDGAWPTAGGSWPMSAQGPPIPVIGVMTGGTFTPFPRRVQALYLNGQATW